MRNLVGWLPSQLYWGYRKAFKTLYGLVSSPSKTNVYSKNWDVLVVLDACRPDLLEEVVEAYSFLPREFETITSVGSNSSEWMEETFVTKYSSEIQQTALVTGNPHSETAIKPNDFGTCDEVWNRAWDTEVGTVPPRPVTDTAIRQWRTESTERMVVHYMQPHFPSISHPDVGAGFEREDGEWIWSEESVWNQLRKGQVDYETVWQAYRDNLHYVLEDVELLLRSIDAETVVLTADHGNAIGEYGFYDHPGGHELPSLLEVPWLETTARDNGEYEPSIQESEHAVDRDEQLQNLGYK
jgi:hypothetical protein